MLSGEQNISGIDTTKNAGSETGKGTYEITNGNNCEAQCQNSEDCGKVEKSGMKHEISFPSRDLGGDLELKLKVENIEEEDQERVVNFDQHMNGSSTAYQRHLFGDEPTVSCQDGIGNREKDNGKISPSETFYVSCIDEGLQNGTSSDESGQTLHPEGEEDLVTKMNDFDSAEKTEKRECLLKTGKDVIVGDFSDDRMVSEGANMDSELMSTFERPSSCLDCSKDFSVQVGCKDKDQGLQSLDNTLDEYESCSEVLSDIDQSHESYSEEVHDGIGEDESSFARPDASNANPEPSYYDTSSLVFSDSQGDVSVDDSSFQSYTSAYWDDHSVSSSSSDSRRGEDTSITDFSSSNVNASNTVDSFDDTSITDLSCLAVNDSDVTDFSFSFRSSSNHRERDFSAHLYNDCDDDSSISESSSSVVDIFSDSFPPSSAPDLSLIKPQGHDHGSFSVHGKCDGSLGMLEISAISHTSDLKYGEIQDSSKIERDLQLSTDEGNDAQTSTSSCILNHQKGASELKTDDNVNIVVGTSSMLCTTKKVNELSERPCADFNLSEGETSQKDYCTNEGMLPEQIVIDRTETETKLGHNSEESLGNRTDEMKKDSSTNINDQVIQVYDCHQEDGETNVQGPLSDIVVKDDCPNGMSAATLPVEAEEEISLRLCEDIPRQNIKKMLEHGSHREPF